MYDPIDDFIQYEHGVEKTAAAPIPNPTPIPVNVAKGAKWTSHAGKALAWGAGTAGAALLGHAALEAYDAAKGAVQKSRGFNSMMDQNPNLKKMDRKKVQAIYTTLHNFNPEMAQDPFVSGAWVKRINEYDYVDPRTIGELVSARGRMGSRAPIDPMALATGMSNVGMRSYEADRESAQRQAFTDAQRQASEDFTAARDEASHHRREQELDASSKFNWHMQNEKMMREDERMREKAWLEKGYYTAKPSPLMEEMHKERQIAAQPGVSPKNIQFEPHPPLTHGERFRESPQPPFGGKPGGPMDPADYPGRK